AAEEVSLFHTMGHVNFTDEVSFGYVLSRIYRRHKPFEKPISTTGDRARIRSIIDNAADGYLSPETIKVLFECVNIPLAKQRTVFTLEEAEKAIEEIQFPMVMKVNGPIHKSDIGGVRLNIKSLEDVRKNFNELMEIADAESVLVQQQKKGIEVFIGASKEEPFGHVILCGLGGIFIEVFKDVTSAIAPVGIDEARSMIQHLKSYPIIQGTRGKEGVNEDLFAQSIVNLSSLLEIAPEIVELDINPLLGTLTELIAVDARIRIEK
ncbi:MAG TPA: acetate--CoA ligase family protein, partial [Bacteroidia bacterium]|nr:acetate--CoA ligase family protein [Bacteroidia bacterium]